MNIKVFQNRKVSKDYFDNEGTQNENYSTTLSFEVPLGYEDFSKRIVFITEDGNFWDYIKDNEYVIKNSITKYENVEAYLWLTKDNQDFRSETFELNFYENQNPDDMTPSEEQLDGYNTLIAELELKVEEVDALKEETLEALEKLKEQQIDYENRFEEINNMLKELKDTNEYQSEIIDQFKNEFDEKEFKGTNAHLPDSAELPLKLQPQGNIEQEVIEAVEGIVVEGSSINVSDVDTNYEDSIMPKGNIEQDTRVGYNLIDTRNAYEVTKAGVTLTVDKEKQEITLNGECTTDNTPFSLNVPMECKAGDYTAGFKYVSGSVTIPSGKISSINLQSNNWKGFITNLANNDYFQNHTISSDLSITYTVIRCDSGCVYNNYKIKPFLASGKDKPFDLYGSMPSIAFPSEVKGVSGHYDNVVENKNIWKPTLVSNGIAILKTRCTVELNEDEYTFTATGNDMYFGNVVATGMPYINSAGTLYEVKDKKTIVINQTNAEFTTNYITYFDENKISVGYGRITNGVPITLADNVKYVCFRTGKFDSVAGTVYKTKIQLEYDVATEYTPHQEQLLPIDIPFNMYSGKAYKENGKWYRDVEWAKQELNSSLTITRYVAGGFDCYRITGLQNLNNSANAKIKSNIFKGIVPIYGENAYIANRKAGDIYINNVINAIDMLTKNGEYADATSFINAVTGNYFVYQLATPIKEEITDTTLIEQLEAFNTAELYEGVTNINAYSSSENVADLPIEAHYNFITPSPSVERPSEVKGVSGHYDNVVENKNLINFKKWYENKEELIVNTTMTINEVTENSITFTPLVYDAFTATYGMSTTYLEKNKEAYEKWSGVQVEENTRYTVSYKRNVSKIRFILFFLDKDFKYLGLIDNIGNGQPITTPNNAKYVTYRVGAEGQKNVQITVSNIQMEKGTVATEYTPHLQQTFPIDLPIGMKMYNDEFFYKDGGDWYFDKKWEKEFITRKSTVIAATTNVVGINRFAFKPIKDFKKNTSATLVLPIYSNILKASSAQDTYLRKNGIAFDLNNIIIYLDECKNMTSTEFKIFCEEHSVYIVYQLANPIPTKITDPMLIQELEDISRAFSYYPVTNVNSYKPTVNVADLILNGKYYVSNKAKFKTLEERVSALENETVNE